MDQERPAQHLDPYEKPPEKLKAIFKNLRGRFDQQKADKEGVVDLKRTCLPALGRIPQDVLLDVLSKFNGHGAPSEHELTYPDFEAQGHVYCSNEIPGLLILPSLVPPQSQRELLSRLLHRDLSDPNHKTNLHLHYDVSYPGNQKSFFSDQPDNISFFPKDANIHKPISTRAALEKKLRWMTLGGQYDWTNKVYPPEKPPEFPTDVADLLGSLFPDMVPQAAIVNLYSPGDTLSLHRDVSEEIDRGLVSISLGCDAIFVIGLHNEQSGETRSAVLRLRSGDAVYMKGESRFAWHGVPSIIPGTCPDYLSDWPGDEFPAWKGWMQGKRINVNVRQMRDSKRIRQSYDFMQIAPEQASE